MERPAQRGARAAGRDPRHHGLEDLPADLAYDLVSAYYPALMRADGSVVDTLLDAVAEGGTLLVVPTRTSTASARTAPQGLGAHHHTDLVLRASRKMTA